jgi:hypothetical protein
MGTMKVSTNHALKQSVGLAYRLTANGRIFSSQQPAAA